MLWNVSLMDSVSEYVIRNASCDVFSRENGLREQASIMNIAKKISTRISPVLYFIDFSI